MNFIEQLEKNCIHYSNLPALRSDNQEVISYEQLWNLSGRIYGFLKEQNIGCESIVLICLPRGINAISAIIGVLRAGAAYSIIESGFASERVNVIQNDINPDLILDETVYEQMMSFESVPGYEITSPHDAAFAIYTSGSTGSPKGVLHEYGKIEQYVRSCFDIFDDSSAGDIVAISSPLSFLASMYFLPALYLGLCSYIMPYSKVKDLKELSEFFLENRIAYGFMTPSLLRLYKDVSPYLKKIMIAAESCDGIYFEKPRIVNRYGSSEMGCIISSFEIDKPYDFTPAGKNTIGIDVFVVDETDKRVLNGVKGEICAYNEFTRGYINLPDKNKTVFVNKIYHTGDLGFIDENGLIHILGRADDMIKINGNRVEPTEIESAIRNTIGIENVVAKGFRSADRSFISVYLLKNELAEKNLLNQKGQLVYSVLEMANRLSDAIPYYMIPSSYVILEEYPKNANGKISRNNLKRPDFRDYLSKYEAPGDEIEKHICELYEKILKIDIVGIHDDFYALGGDSLSTIQFIDECGLDGLSFSDIYHCRTPKRIAELCRDRAYDNVDPDENNKSAISHAQPLLPEMIDIIDYSFIMPKSAMWNLPLLLRMKKGMDPDRLAAAVDKVLSAHPVFLTQIFFDETFDLRQEYRPGSYSGIQKIYIDNAMLKEKTSEMVKTFSIINNSLHREYIIITEEDVYLFFDIHHLITDGSSIHLILHQIFECYDHPDYSIPKDDYDLLVSDFHKKQKNEETTHVAMYYDEMFRKLTNSGTYSSLPKFDFKSIRWEKGLFEKNIALSKNEFKKTKIAELTEENIFFMAALALTIKNYNETQNSVVQWIYNGRNTKLAQNVCGLLYKTLTLFSFFDPEKTITEYISDVKDQALFCIDNCDYFINDAIGDALDDSLFYLYQNDIYSFDRYDYIEAEEKINAADEASDSFMDFNIIDNDSENIYKCRIEYSASHYAPESIERFYNLFEKIVLKLASIEDIGSTLLSDMIINE